MKPTVSEQEQMKQVSGMIMAMVKPIIKSSYGTPQNDSVKEQEDILASAVMKIFPQMEVFLNEADLKGLLYNVKQNQLDEFYNVVYIAAQHRRT